MVVESATLPTYGMALARVHQSFYVAAPSVSSASDGFDSFRNQEALLEEAEHVL